MPSTVPAANARRYASCAARVGAAATSSTRIAAPPASPCSSPNPRERRASPPGCACSWASPRAWLCKWRCGPAPWLCTCMCQRPYAYRSKTEPPRPMSSSATSRSAAGQSRCGTCSPPTMITSTTTPTLAVWPAAHAKPSRQASNKLPCRVARVDTAARWSGSKAWRKPSSKPMPQRATIPGLI